MLKCLRYTDKPDYDFLAKCLRQVVIRLNIKMDDPFDWDLGYENLTKLRAPALGTSRRSDTIAFREKGYRSLSHYHYLLQGVKSILI